MYRFRLFLVAVFVSFLSFSQTQEKIDVNKDIDVVKVYLQVVKEGYGTSFIYKELANAFYLRGNYSESKKWFEKLFAEEETADATMKYRYNQSLKALGLNTEGDTGLSKFGTN